MEATVVSNAGSSYLLNFDTPGVVAVTHRDGTSVFRFREADARVALETLDRLNQGTAWSR